MKENSKLNVIECTEEQYENAIWKNQQIAEYLNEYLGISDFQVATAAEIQTFMEENAVLWKYKILLFAEGISEGVCGKNELLHDPEIKIYGYIFRRNLLQNTGKFNTRLRIRTNYEFLCRLNREESIYCIPCTTEDIGSKKICERAVSENDASADAYILRSHWNELAEHERMAVLSAFLGRYGSQAGMLQQAIEKIFSDDIVYQKYADNTAPILLLNPDSTCYGVLQNFCEEIGREFIDNGQAVKNIDKIEQSEVWKNRWKAVIGFQAPTLEREAWKAITKVRMQFWFDNPLFFDFFARESSVYYLCQDASYARYLRKYYQIEHAIQLPPGGQDVGLSQNDHREYDLVFIGTYMLPGERDTWTEEQNAYYAYMLEHRSMTFEEGLSNFEGGKYRNVSTQKFIEKLHEMRDVCWEITKRNRQDVMEAILKSGISVDVYGESWRNFPTPYRKYLKIHEEISVEESLAILGHAKLGLNIMSWHKEGMTERIANIMLSGAVCISDETGYLRQHFEDKQEIVLYSLNDPEQLPTMILKLLANETERQKIADAGYRRACREHTWKNRVDSMLQIMEQTE